MSGAIPLIPLYAFWYDRDFLPLFFTTSRLPLERIQGVQGQDISHGVFTDRDVNL